MSYKKCFRRLLNEAIHTVESAKPEKETERRKSLLDNEFPSDSY